MPQAYTCCSASATVRVLPPMSGEVLATNYVEL